jgi:hypothetical protein
MAASLAITAGATSPAATKGRHVPLRSLANVPNKVALAAWPKAHPATSRNDVNIQKLSSFNSLSKGIPANRALSQKIQTFKCGLLYSGSWDEDSYDYGAYSFALNDLNTFTQHYVNTSAPANAGGFFTEDKYYFTSYVTDDYGYDYSVTTYVVDTNTWKVLETVDQGSLYAMATDLAYDPVEKVAFGTFYNGSDSGAYWGYMDPSTCEITEIASVDGQLVAVAANQQGEIYGITSGGYLVKVGKYTGEFTVIGNTNITPAYLQSATFDDNGTFYWAAGFTDGSTGLFTVDLETARVTLVDAFDNDEEVVSLFAEPLPADDGAPAEASNLALSFVADALNGQFMFDVPSLDNLGAAMTGTVGYTVSIDGTDFATGTAAVGTTASVSVSVSAPGVHSFSVRLSNDAGETRRASITQWVGIDRPVAVTDLVMKKTGDLQASISWTAPTKGALDGYFDASRLSYTVTRLPEGKVVAQGLKATTFVDNMEYDNKVYVTYKVTPYADTAEGAATISNGAVFGYALEPPVKLTFDTEADYNIFTVIDNNETVNLDSGMWQYTASGQCAGYVSGTKDGDDWLITPEIKMKNDRQYTFSYDVLCYSDYWPDEYEVYMGNDATIEAMTTQLVAPTTIYWDEYRTVTLTVTVPENGTYNFGFHALSEAGGAFFLIDNVKLSESYMLKAPAKVEDLTATAGANGAPTATVSFKAPTLAVDGSSLTSLSAVKVYRYAELVKTFENPAPGAQLTFEDTDLGEGDYDYKVVAENEVGSGVESTVSVWVGVDTPSEPTNVRVTVVNGHPVITWEAPEGVGQNGGYVDNANLTYIVYRATDGTILARDLKAYTYTDEAVTIPDTGAQSMHQYMVFAQSTAGIGFNASAFVIEGSNYDMPIVESFANGTSNRLWVSYGTEDDYWKIADNWSADPYDGDNGLLLLTPYTPGSVSTFMSGKISMANAKNPTLTFYLEVMTYEDNGFAETDPKDDYLEVLVASSDYQFKTVKTIYPNDVTKGKFLQYVVPLNDYVNEDFILVGFRANSVAARAPMAIDAITIANNYDYNLLASELTLPESVVVTEDFTGTVTVTNGGANAVKDFTVKVSCNGETLASQTDSEELAAGESRSYTFNLTALPTWSDTPTLEASVEYAADEYADDNTCTATTTVIRPDMPTVNDLAVNVSDNGEATFTWSEPVVSEFANVTEGFESYTHGSLKNVGDWTLTDEDQVYGVDDFIANGDYIDIPHPFARQSFMVFNPESAGINTATAPEWATHSGKQMMVCFHNWENDNDDWLISPELSGKAQTISFWARSTADATDKIIFNTSTTDTDVDSFTRHEDGRITLGTEWTKYTFDLEEGTKYFAIRYNQQNGAAVMVDDIEFEAVSTLSVKAAVEGYNLYNDGNKVNSAVIVATSYTVASNIDGTYVVKVVYNVGESAASNSVVVGDSGIENVVIDTENQSPVYDIYGRRVTTLNNGQFYIRKGEKFLFQK